VLDHKGEERRARTFFYIRQDPIGWPGILRRAEAFGSRRKRELNGLRAGQAGWTAGDRN